MTFSPRIDETHNAALQSWVESANDPATDFPIQNLPLTCFEASHDGHTHAHYATIIGDQVLDVSMLVEAGYIGMEEGDEPLAEALEYPAAMGLLDDADARKLWRTVLQRFLGMGNAASGGQQMRRLRQKALRPLADTTLVRPIATFNYTDFYASIDHAATVGSMFRPDHALLLNYRWVPIGYHGRNSSIVASGTPIRRPSGQISPPEGQPEAPPTFGPCTMLDYELELAAVIGRGNELGETIPIASAREHLFGLCLLNDWSARDIQKWEYQPLGPFLAKNFATTTSCAVVTVDALEPFRCAARERSGGDPKPLPYLADAEDQALGGFDITLEVYLQSAQMRERGLAPMRLSRGSFKTMYWTFAQLIAHHASNGCNLQSGDLLGSGTISGPMPESRGCLLELTWQGRGPDGKPLPRQALELPGGEKRMFLQDGDRVSFRAFCEREGFRRIGLGACEGTIVGG